MTLTRISPWGRKQMPVRGTDAYRLPTLLTDFDDSFKEMDRLFERFLNLSPAVMSGGSMQQDFSPVLDVHETEKEFRINLEVPGMSEKDIDISMSRDVLTISGEKKEEKEENAKGIYRVERRYGTFSRSIPLPDNCVDSEKVEATFKNGVLSIKLPKVTEYKDSVRKIPIQHDKTSNSGGGTPATPLNNT